MTDLPVDTQTHLWVECTETMPTLWNSFKRVVTCEAKFDEDARRVADKLLHAVHTQLEKRDGRL